MSRSLRFENIEIEYNDSGRGQALVLLHGYLEAKEVWNPVVEILERSYRVISVDLPGHGNSGVAGEVHTMEFLAESVRMVVEQTGVKRILLAGHSLGGYVTLAFLEKYPDMLAGYVLFHSHPEADTPEAIAKRNREIMVVEAGKKDIMYPANISMMFAEKNLPHMASALARSKQIASLIPARGIIAMLNGMMVRPSRVSVLEKGIVPLLWLLGRHDRYFSPEKVLATIKIPENGRVAILENSGHLGFIEETEVSTKLICEFAEGLKW